MESMRCLLKVMIWLSFAFLARSADDFSCVYTFYIKTGSIIKAGTDSKINLELWNKYGDGVRISDIENWGGLMGQKYDYFERGNLDIFSGKGPCLSASVCALKVVSDGSGPHHGWYLDYVEVTTTGPHTSCAQHKFEVKQWLATDTAPYELTAERDFCPYDDLSKGRPTNLRAVSSA
ncbi:PLAT domain-containing protein 3-like [Silene latifolia]|uniref:PLAT domain-containing protein 3-like n=1 Tax=Silene latifolia TaxID=37657 RepID=UPI003D78279F